MRIANSDLNDCHLNDEGSDLSPKYSGHCPPTPVTRFAAARQEADGLHAADGGFVVPDVPTLSDGAVVVRR